MKRKNDAGFSLIEVLVAITLLAAIVVPTCSSLIMSFRMNAKTEKMLQAQLAVSSAVETLMAEGIPSDYTSYIKDGDYGYQNVSVTQSDGTVKDEFVDQFPNVKIVVEQATTGEGASEVYHPYYNVKVTSVADEDVSVTTVIRVAETEEIGETPTETTGGTS